MESKLSALLLMKLSWRKCQHVTRIQHPATFPLPNSLAEQPSAQRHMKNQCVLYASRCKSELPDKANRSVTVPLPTLSKQVRHSWSIQRREGESGEKAVFCSYFSFPGDGLGALSLWKQRPSYRISSHSKTMISHVCRLSTGSNKLPQGTQLGRGRTRVCIQVFQIPFSSHYTTWSHVHTHTHTHMHTNNLGARQCHEHYMNDRNATDCFKM